MAFPTNSDPKSQRFEDHLHLLIFCIEMSWKGKRADVQPGEKLSAPVI